MNAGRSIGSITVRELRQALFEVEDQDAMVVFTSDYGDIGHTQQVHPISGDVEEVALEESAYSRSGWAIRSDEDYDEDRDEPEGEDDAPRMLVIR
jgi:hypothetical protein